MRAALVGWLARRSSSNDSGSSGGGGGGAGAVGERRSSAPDAGRLATRAPRPLSPAKAAAQPPLSSARGDHGFSGDEQQQDNAAQHDRLPCSPSPSSSSHLIAIAAACPPTLRATTAPWSSSSFEIDGDIDGCSPLLCTTSVRRAVQRATGQVVALKRYDRAMLEQGGALTRHQVAREVWLHSQLPPHTHLVSMYAAWTEREGDVCMALEWCSGGDVRQLLGRQPGGKMREREAAERVVAPVVAALVFLHSLGIIHRDVKPDNVLLSGPRKEAKLGDLGLAIHTGYERPRMRLGTLEYLAPEVVAVAGGVAAAQKQTTPAAALADEPGAVGDTASAAPYDAKVDCWSVGVLAHELVLGRAPFEDECVAGGGLTAERLLARLSVASDKTPLVDPPSELFSPLAADFVRRATERDPRKRASMAELAAHPWLQQHASAGDEQQRQQRRVSCDDGASPRTPRLDQQQQQSQQREQQQQLPQDWWAERRARGQRRGSEGGGGGGR